ncbi:MAG: EAL domain-containing protein, partial [Gammaproteobacteria bacterium]
AEEARWGERVRALLEQGRLRLLYQPIVAVGTGAVYDYEVLARLEDEGGRVISPGGFLPTVERLGLARELDHLVVRRAVDALASLRQAGHPVRFSVNLTAHALEDPELPGLLRELLQETGLDPAALTFEITETAAVADLPAATAFAQALKELGAQLALDHFGSGFGSFAYLQRLPVDKLKISGAYVQGLSQSVVNQSVVRSMNQVAHALGRSTVAAMVESREALALVRDLGVDFAEGYFLGPPSEELPRERFLDVTLH